MNTGSQDNRDAAELTLAHMLSVLKQHRVALVSVWVACVILAVAAAFLSTPIYRAEAKVAAAGEAAAAPGGDLSSLISRFSAVPGMGAIGKLSQRDTMTESIVTMRSPSFLMEFIDAGNLKPVLFAHLWDAENKAWLVDSEADIPTDEDAYILFREEVLSVTESKATPGIVTVAVEWSDRKQAALWANTLISRLNERLRQAAIDEANQTIEYLNQELEKARIVEVRQAIYFMIENRINLRTVANVREEYALKVLSEAVAPDEDRFVRPNRGFMVVIGVLAGLVAGVFTCFLLFAIGQSSTTGRSRAKPADARSGH